MFQDTWWGISHSCGARCCVRLRPTLAHVFEAPHGKKHFLVGWDAMLDPTQFKHFCFKPPKGGKHNFFVEQCTMLGFVTLAFVAWKSLWVGGGHNTMGTITIFVKDIWNISCSWGQGLHGAHQKHGPRTWTPWCPAWALPYSWNTSTKPRP